MFGTSNKFTPILIVFLNKLHIIITFFLIVFLGKSQNTLMNDYYGIPVVSKYVFGHSIIPNEKLYSKTLSIFTFSLSKHKQFSLLTLPYKMDVNDDKSTVLWCSDVYFHFTVLR